MDDIIPGYVERGLSRDRPWGRFYTCNGLESEPKTTSQPINDIGVFSSPQLPPLSRKMAPEGRPLGRRNDALDTQPEVKVVNITAKREHEME